MLKWRSVADYAEDLGYSSEYMELMFDVLRTAQGMVSKWEEK